jgi:hypothetical protein
MMTPFECLDLRLRVVQLAAKENWFEEISLMLWR